MRVISVFIAGLLLVIIMPGALAMSVSESFHIGNRTVSYDTNSIADVHGEYDQTGLVKGVPVTFHMRNIGGNVTANGTDLGPMVVFSVIEFASPFDTAVDLDLTQSVKANLGTGVYKDAKVDLHLRTFSGENGVIGTSVIPQLGNLEIGAGWFLVPGSRSEAVSFVVYGNRQYYESVVNTVRVV